MTWLCVLLQVDNALKEAEICYQLRHPNIVELIGVCVCPPSLNLVFEFCKFGDLRMLLDAILTKRQGTLLALSPRTRSATLSCPLVLCQKKGSSTHHRPVTIAMRSMAASVSLMHPTTPRRPCRGDRTLNPTQTAKTMRKQLCPPQLDT